MKRLFWLIFALFIEASIAAPPSYWQKIASSKAEGLIALQKAQLAYRGQRWAEAFGFAVVAREFAPSVEADYIYALSLLRVSPELQDLRDDCAGILNLLLSVRERSEYLGAEPEVYLGAGLCAGVIGEYEMSIQENTLLAYHPNAELDFTFLGFANLGDALMVTQDLSGAIKAYTSAFHIAPNESYVSFALAVSLYRSNDSKATKVALQRALTLDPYFESLGGSETIFIPEEDKYFFFAMAEAGSGNPGAAHSNLGRYLSEAPQGLYRDVAMRAFLNIEAFSKELSSP